MVSVTPGRGAGWMAQTLGTPVKVNGWQDDNQEDGGSQQRPGESDVMLPQAGNYPLGAPEKTSGAGESTPQETV